jgi:hypothetical protein
LLRISAKKLIIKEYLKLVTKEGEMKKNQEKRKRREVKDAMKKQRNNMEW